jgi:hypothetical protein
VSRRSLAACPPRVDKTRVIGDRYAVVMTSVVLPLAIAAGLIGLLWVSAWAGRTLGQRRRSFDGPEPAHLGAVQGAILGLLGLLLGFSFSGAMSRFVDRQDIIVREANAIGTAWLRADLLSESHRAQVRSILSRYLDERLRLFGAGSTGEGKAIERELAGIHASLWAAAIEGVRDQPTATAMVLNPVNEIADLLATRNNATHRHIPATTLIVLLACAAVSVASVSYSTAASGKSKGGDACVAARVPTAILALLIGATLWVIIDLDYPSRGVIRISDEPLREARESMAMTPGP